MECSPNSAEVPDLLYGSYLVAFIDIQGQQVACERLSRYRKPAWEDDDFLRLVKETFGVVVGVRQLFHKLYAGYMSERFVDKFPVEVQTKVREAMNCPVKFQTFTDTVIAYVPLDLHRDPLHAVRAALLACAGCFLYTLVGKHALRGGIEIDAAGEIDGKEIYGPALVTAYRLESNVAEYPRIVVGDGVREYLGTTLSTLGDDLDGRILRSTAEECLGLLAADIDGSTILDYLGATIHKLLEMIGDEDRMRQAKDFLSYRMVQAATDGDTELASRCSQALRYFASRGFGQWP